MNIVRTIKQEVVTTAEDAQASILYPNCLECGAPLTPDKWESGYCGCLDFCKDCGQKLKLYRGKRIHESREAGKLCFRVRNGYAYRPD